MHVMVEFMVVCRMKFMSGLCVRQHDCNACVPIVPQHIEREGEGVS